MPSITHNAQCFMIDGRRIWLIGASVHYARIPRELWAERIAQAAQAGFNAIDTPCPWMLHEPRKGRFDFEGSADVAHFIRLCQEQGLYVILRPGPFVGDGYDGGGLPGWLLNLPEIAVREANPSYLERAGQYLRQLAQQVAPLQVTKGGPVVLVQAEHAWQSSNPQQARDYLVEMVRVLRESGIDVPITNANDLWQDVTGTIDTWRGWDELLVHLRQFRTLNSNRPRIVSALNVAPIMTWGRKDVPAQSPEAALWHLAEVLASGAQVVVSPFHGGTNFGFTGGQLPGEEGGGVMTSPSPAAPLGEAGERTPLYAAIKRLATFASHFGHVFAELDPEFQPVALSLEELSPPTGDGARGGGRRSAGPCVSIISQRGAQGRVIFVFSDGRTDSATLLLDDGLRMPVHLGDQPVSWYVLDADLAGAGRLDYANLCPWGTIDRSVAVFFGPERSPAFLSIDDTPIETTVPRGGKPVVLKHKELHIVICNPQQIDAAYIRNGTLYIGIAGFDAQGNPIPHPDFAKAELIHRSGETESVAFDHPLMEDVSSKGGRNRGSAKPRARTIKLGDWEAAPTTEHIDGESPRFASLGGPETLTNCGASSGYGWYRVEFRSDSTRKRCLHFPQAADRLHLFINGQPHGVIGTGPGAIEQPFELNLPKGDCTLVVLADNMGRFADGNDLSALKGLFGHLCDVKSLGRVRPKEVDANVVDPFTVRGYIAHRAAGQFGDTRQLVWSFEHRKKAPIIVQVNRAPVTGTFVLNDQPLAYYGAATGVQPWHLVLDPGSLESFKRGRNELRFAPDSLEHPGLDSVKEATVLFECTDNLTEGGRWGFARWEPPAATMYEMLSDGAIKKLKGIPVWWRTSFNIDPSPLPAWLEVEGLSKGQAYLNGMNLGRYFTATDTAKPVGPQTCLYLPEPWLQPDAENELVIFDEHGFAPGKVRVRRESCRPE